MREQRCRVYWTANVTGALPKSLRERDRLDIHEIWRVETKDGANAAFDRFVKNYGVKYEKAVGMRVKDRDELLTFHDFLTQRCRHIRTTNPTRSVFATVRGRTRRTRGCLRVCSIS